MEQQKYIAAIDTERNYVTATNTVTAMRIYCNLRQSLVRWCRPLALIGELFLHVAALQRHLRLLFFHASLERRVLAP